jgi:hypothetical protein
MQWAGRGLRQIEERTKSTTAARGVYFEVKGAELNYARVRNKLVPYLPAQFSDEWLSNPFASRWLASSNKTAVK